MENDIRRTGNETPGPDSAKSEMAELGSAEPGLMELEQPGFIEWASGCWAIPLETGQDSCRIHGSPERSMSRGIARDRSGQRYLVEKFSVRHQRLKEDIAQTLAALNHKGLEQVLVPERGLQGGFLNQHGDAVYQVTRFIPGTTLPRPGWLGSEHRGTAMAEFLSNMAGCSRDLTPVSPCFSIRDYIIRLFDEMAAHHPHRYRQYLPVLRFLERQFMEIHDHLPTVFCHGDFHPINVIWNGERIKAIVDWEFTGMKPESYDAANLLGCAGIEHPEGLVMPMSIAFLDRLHQAGIISPLGWQWLPEFVLALRFAWLAEWLRKNDQEMLDTEFRFMEIIMDHAEDLRDIWAHIRR